MGDFIGRKIDYSHVGLKNFLIFYFFVNLQKSLMSNFIYF